MKITDGKKTVSIRMMVWEGSGYSPDWSQDFFEAGSLTYNEDTDTYTVDDVDYCIDQAMEWKETNEGFLGEIKTENNCVWVDEV